MWWPPVSAVTPSPTWRGRVSSAAWICTSSSARFDGYFVSGLEGVGKPDPRYFKLALERFGLVPAETLFTDDKPDNVAAAAAVGLQATVFTDAASLRAELAARGVLAK